MVRKPSESVRRPSVVVDPVVFLAETDDGKHPERYPEAHVIVLGISCSGKTSVVSELARQGVRAANCPIVPGCPLPDELFRLIDPRRVYLLEVALDALVDRREQRVATLGYTPPDFADFESIRLEVARVHREAVLHRSWRRAHVYARDTPAEIALAIIEGLKRDLGPDALS